MQHPPKSLPEGQGRRAERSSGLSIAAWWNLTRKHRFGILGFSLLCGLGAFLYASSLVPVYRAETCLLLDTRGRVGADAAGGPATWLSSRDASSYLKTQTVLMRSRTLAESVIDRLKLADGTGFKALGSGSDWQLWIPGGLRDQLPPGWWPLASDPSPIQEQARAAAVETLSSGIEAEVVAGTDLVGLSFSATDPGLAASVVNAYADAYIELGYETRLRALTKATGWLTERLDALRAQVEASEARLQAFQEEEGLTVTDQALDLTAKQLQELADRLVEAQARHDELERLDAQVRLMGEAPSAEAITPALMVRSPDIQGLQGAVLQTGREVTELAKRYGPKHPKMLAARSNLETLTAGLTKAVADAVTAVRRDLGAAATDLAQLEAELAARKAQAQEAGRHEAELRSLRRDLETDRQLYDSFLTRFKEAGQGVEGETAPARVIDPALVSSRPVGPRIGVWVTIAVLLALVLGAVAVLVSEYLDNTVQSGEGLEESLSLMVLGSLPLLGRWRTRRVLPERMFLEHPRSEFAEAIRSIRAGLVLAGQEGVLRTLLVTSSVPGEGRTTLAVSLALAMGRRDRTLLIDADLRRPALGARFGLDSDSPGLGDLVTGSAEEGACIHAIEGQQVDVLPAGNLPAEPLELLSSPRLPEILAGLAARYERIVIDSAPAQSDALILARLCDGVVLVVGANQTQVPVVQATLGRLRHVGAPLLGTVLNRYDLRRVARYGHCHQGRYRRCAGALQGYRG